MTLTEGFMGTHRWTVGGVRVDYLSEVRSETLSGCSCGHGPIGKIVEENLALGLRVHEQSAELAKARDDAHHLVHTIAERDEAIRNARASDHATEQVIAGLKAENERLGAESAKRLADMHYLDVVLQGSRAKQDELKAENDRLVREAAAGQLKPELNTIAVGNALIQPTSMRIELPGGVVITIPQPKE